MEPTRTEFMYFSTPEKLLFYVFVFSSLGYMAWQFADRVRLWRKGRPIDGGDGKWGMPRGDALKGWLRNVVVYVLGQKKVRSSRQKSGAPMHLAIFYGFMTLVLATTLLGINTYSPVKFHKGVYYLIFEQVSDWMGLVFIIGVGWALVRRFIKSKGDLGAAGLRETLETESANLSAQRQEEQMRRRPVTTAATDYWTLALLLVLGLTGFWVEAARISVAPQPWDWTDPVGIQWAHLQGDWSGLSNKETLYKTIWWFHACWVFLFFAVIPKMRLRHILVAIGAAAGVTDQPMGRLRTISMEEVEQTEQVGTKVGADLSRWQLMSLDACMECGRCTEVCPAWNVGKLLNPKQVVQDLRSATVDGVDLAERVSEEALWACTTCNACVEACPVLIRHVDLIVDVRRNLVSEGRLSGSAATMLRQVGSTSNAWGAQADSREDWMKGLDIPLCRSGVEFDWLFWVGCAGATDPGAVKTTKAVAELLTKADIKFACLGREEACTGDPARRVGEEFLFQEKAGINVEVFQRYGVKKVVTACPHCFNTLKNEYPAMGVELEVAHHTQLISTLIDKGSLLAANPQRGEVVLHDPCYLTRVNEEVAAPRAMLSGAGIEPEHAGRKTLCCGAGGGRMWMEEAPDQRPANRRAKELADTGATTVAVACPFCRIMVGDALRQVQGNRVQGDHVQGDREINLVDLAELVLEANRSSSK